MYVSQTTSADHFARTISTNDLDELKARTQESCDAQERALEPKYRQNNDQTETLPGLGGNFSHFGTRADFATIMRSRENQKSHVTHFEPLLARNRHMGDEKESSSNCCLQRVEVPWNAKPNSKI